MKLSSRQGAAGLAGGVPFLRSNQDQRSSLPWQAPWTLSASTYSADSRWQTSGKPEHKKQSLCQERKLHFGPKSSKNTGIYWKHAQIHPRTCWYTATKHTANINAFSRRLIGDMIRAIAAGQMCRFSLLLHCALRCHAPL